jgi:predicted dienelactone hydrolase
MRNRKRLVRQNLASCTMTNSRNAIVTRTPRVRNRQDETIILGCLLLLAAFLPSRAVSAQPPAATYSVAVSDMNWSDGQRGRTIPVRIYSPGDASERFPVLVFSTGLGRSRDDCAYLGRRWAGCGYVAVFVQHPGSDEEAGSGVRKRKKLQHEFYDQDNIRNRPLDLIFVIDRLEQMAGDGSPLGQRFDMTRLGASGHDFGTQTVLALAGQVLPGGVSFPDKRVKAVVAMSPPVPLGQVPLWAAYTDVSIPCLFITGTADNSIVGTTQAYQRRLPFDHVSAGDQYLITLNGADHMTYSGHIRAANGGNDAMFQRLMADSSLVFWDAYLKHSDAAKTWLAGQGIESYLGRTGSVERKPTP